MGKSWRKVTRTLWCRRTDLHTQLAGQREQLRPDEPVLLVVQREVESVAAVQQPVEERHRGAHAELHLVVLVQIERDGVNAGADRIVAGEPAAPRVVAEEPRDLRRERARLPRLI